MVTVLDRNRGKARPEIEPHPSSPSTSVAINAVFRGTVFSETAFGARRAARRTRARAFVDRGGTT